TEPTPKAIDEIKGASIIQGGQRLPRRDAGEHEGLPFRRSALNTLPWQGSSVVELGSTGRRSLNEPESQSGSRAPRCQIGMGAELADAVFFDHAENLIGIGGGEDKRAAQYEALARVGVPPLSWTPSPASDEKGDASHASRSMIGASSPRAPGSNAV